MPEHLERFPSVVPTAMVEIVQEESEIERRDDVGEVVRPAAGPDERECEVRVKAAGHRDLPEVRNLPVRVGPCRAKKKKKKKKKKRVKSRAPAEPDRRLLTTVALPCVLRASVYGGILVQVIPRWTRSWRMKSEAGRASRSPSDKLTLGGGLS